VTTIESTVPDLAAVKHAQRQVSGSERRRKAIPVATMALGAFLAGGLLGGAAAVTATEEVVGRAAVLEFARNLEVARQWDDRSREMYELTHKYSR